MGSVVGVGLNRRENLICSVLGSKHVELRVRLYNAIVVMGIMVRVRVRSLPRHSEDLPQP